MVFLEHWPEKTGTRIYADVPRFFVKLDIFQRRSVSARFSFSFRVASIFDSRLWTVAVAAELFHRVNGEAGSRGL
jgi:hypothetical protein